MSEDWKTFKMPFGKHRNQSMYDIFLNDYEYINWLDGLDLHDDTRKAVNGAIEYHNIHSIE